MAEEVELKLRLENIEERDRIAAALGNRVARVEQANVYFDTEDDALARHRWAVRVRHQDDKTVLTLKGEGSEDGDFTIRLELEKRLPEGAWPKVIRNELDVAGEVRALLDEHGHALPADADLDGLEKLGLVSNVRSIYALPGTPLLVELDETEYPDFSLHYEAELEVPAEEDRRAAISSLREVFDRAGVPWRPSSESKYARFRAVLASMGV